MNDLLMDFDRLERSGGFGSLDEEIESLGRDAVGGYPTDSALDLVELEGLTDYLDLDLDQGGSMSSNAEPQLPINLRDLVPRRRRRASPITARATQVLQSFVEGRSLKDTTREDLRRLGEEAGCSETTMVQVYEGVVMGYGDYLVRGEVSAVTVWTLHRSSDRTELSIETDGSGNHRTPALATTPPGTELEPGPRQLINEILDRLAALEAWVEAHPPERPAE